MSLLTVLCSTGTSGVATLAHADAVSEVVPINWASFDRPLPTDGTVGLAVLRNANKYAVTEWWNTVKEFDDDPPDQCLDFGGVGELHIRPPASEASSLAISLKLGGYSAAVTGVSDAAATAIARRLAASLACRHRVNQPAGWGHNWQSAYWAYQAGYAGWLLWGDLTTSERTHVANMVENEADRFNAHAVLYYRRDDGSIRRPGDSWAEENAWNASLLQLATAMMPNHPRRNIWMNKLLELQVSSFSRPTDTTSTRIINGRTVASWIDGSNAEPNGAVVNHGYSVHPDYMATVQLQAGAPVIFGLAGMGTPESALFNADVIYDALVDLSFPSVDPYEPPGGTIYARTAGGSASDVLYYPQGTDWGTKVRANFAALDAHAFKFGYDRLASIKGNIWEPLHSQTLLDLQSRFTTGQTYPDWDDLEGRDEFKYEGREEVVAELAARQWAAHWIVAQDAFEISTAGGDGLGNIDDMTSAFAYSGAWTTYVDANDIGGRHHTANSPGASASISFTGSRGRLISLRAHNRGIGKVYLDGVFKANVDFYNPTTQYQYVAYDTGPISPGNHTLRLDWTGTKNPSASNTYVDVDAVRVSRAAEAGTTDESRSAFDFSGTWEHYTDASSLWEGHQTANTSGASASISFMGTRGRLISLRAHNRGIGKVYLDGVLKANVDFYNPTTEYQFVAYDTGPIAPGAHTLRLEWTGTKNPNSINTYVDVDGVTVTG